ncbi:reductive dehalogenase domain-containing protein [Pseudooctadecabacter sp.]|uniref:reductive dehalogenase domain-containing protein n=1 Tax=Pseudooctadecabacter sp. TaxID=1966338 RepID=UPI0025CD44C9|nr:reductive dehalogenase domain-containing protein [Pseudooctadecabacter sp.]
MTGPVRTPDHLRASDAAAGFEVADDFAPFNQMNDIFTRAMWDDRVRSADTDAFFASYRMEAAPRRGEGFGPRDFALRNAAWLVSDIISNRAAEDGLREGFQGAIRNDTPVAAQRVDLAPPEAEAAEIKRLARFFGADLCGITHIDPRWHYTHRPDTKTMEPVPNTLPDGLTHVIVMGHEMDKALVDTYPSALAGAATGREYSHEAAIVMQLAAYIRNLGFEAVASMNDTALVIPYAIKAGLGEYGRNQMVITPDFGPRVRFSKIFTDMPLAVDAVRELGIARYCRDCTICADACPPKALPKGAPDFGAEVAGGSPSTQTGVRKWSANCEACFGYWAKIKTDCAICMRVCPFNHHARGTLWYRLATSRWRLIARWWAARRRPARLKPSKWWAQSR